MNFSPWSKWCIPNFSLKVHGFIEIDTHFRIFKLCCLFTNLDMLIYCYLIRCVSGQWKAKFIFHIQWIIEKGFKTSLLNCWESQIFYADQTGGMDWPDQIFLSYFLFKYSWLRHIGLQNSLHILAGNAFSKTFRQHFSAAIFSVFLLDRLENQNFVSARQAGGKDWPD